MSLKVLHFFTIDQSEQGDISLNGRLTQSNEEIDDRMLVATSKTFTET